MNNNSNELQHHGVPGMRWGIRRYQYKDGSLTPAGKKKAAKMKEEYTQLTGKRLIRKPTKKPVTKSRSDDDDNDLYKRKNSKKMSDNELREKTNRLNLENNYNQAINRYNELNPKKVSKGRAFVNKVTKDILIPAVTETAKERVKAMLKESLDSADKKKK